MTMETQFSIIVVIIVIIPLALGLSFYLTMCETDLSQILMDGTPLQYTAKKDFLVRILISRLSSLEFERYKVNSYS